MLRTLKTVLFISLLTVFSSCEKYQKVEENSPFSIIATVKSLNQDAPKGCVALDVSIMTGTVSGSCSLELKLVSRGTLKQQDCRLYLSDGTELLDDSQWKFGNDGVAHFLIDDIPSGEYSAEIVVRRWYHSASCNVEFKY